MEFRRLGLVPYEQAWALQRELHAGVVAELKDLQDNLGRFQDTQVQHDALEGFADRLMAGAGTPAATLLAIGKLVGTFDASQRAARAEFAERFAAFSSAGNRERVAALLGSDR